MKDQRCHVCGLPIEDETWMTVILKNRNRKSHESWRLNMHNGRCYDTYVLSAAELIQAVPKK